MNAWVKEAGAMGFAVGVVLFITVVGAALDSGNQGTQSWEKSVYRLSLFPLLHSGDISTLPEGPITTLPKVDNSWLPLSLERQQEQLYLRWKMDLNRPVPSKEP